MKTENTRPAFDFNAVEAEALFAADLEGLNGERRQLVAKLKQAEAACQAAYAEWEAAKQATEAAKEKWAAASLVARKLEAKIETARLFPTA